jgi:hypothetical protein
MTTEPLQIDHLTVRHEYEKEVMRILNCAARYLDEREYRFLMSDIKSYSQDVLNYM